MAYLGRKYSCARRNVPFFVPFCFLVSFAVAGTETLSILVESIYLVYAVAGSGLSVTLQI
jgi:hypothetical protein